MASPDTDTLQSTNHPDSDNDDEDDFSSIGAFVGLCSHYERFVT